MADRESGNKENNFDHMHISYQFLDDVSYSRWIAALLVVLCLVLYLPGFFTLPPIDRDESRFAQASKQMLETSDFIDIRFQDEPRYKKPVGIYWLQAASTTILGDYRQAQIWTYRIPSLIGSIIAVLGTWLIGRRFFGHSAGLTAGIVLACTFLLGFESRQAKTDAVLLATIVMCQLCLAQLYHSYLSNKIPHPVSWIGFWLAIGFGILIKGPIILLVSGGTILMLCLLERKAKLALCTHPLPGILIAIAINVPWLIMITQIAGSSFFEESLGKDLFGKAVSVQESHFGPPGYYLMTFWAMFWPFGLVLGLGGKWIWNNRKSPDIRFCLAWTIPSLILFEIIPTKLPHYLLPVFPALAILTGRIVQEAKIWNGRISGVIEWSILFLSLLGTAVVAVIVVIMPVYFGFDSIPALLSGIVGLLLCITGMLAIAKDKKHISRSVIYLAPAAFIVLFGTYAAVLPNMNQLHLSKEIKNYLDSQPYDCAKSNLIVAGFAEPSIVFLNGTKTRLVSLEQAIDLIKNTECSTLLIESRLSQRFQKITKNQEKIVNLKYSTSGFNYSQGRYVQLDLYQVR